MDMLSILELIARLIPIFFFGAIGASVASFLCLLVERRLRGESIMPSSHCACGRLLKVHENIPILGWLSVRGRTKCCNVQLPLHYVLAEAGLCAAWALLAVVFTNWLIIIPLGVVLSVALWYVLRAQARGRITAQNI